MFLKFCNIHREVAGMQLYWKQTVAQVFCALATAGLGEGAVLVAVCLGVAGGCFSCGAGCWAALLNSVCWNWSGRSILWELV